MQVVLCVADRVQANDNTGKGKSCDDPDPKLGCIFTTGALVLDVSQQEIASAVADVTPTFTGTGGLSATGLVDLAKFKQAGGAGAGAANAVAATEVAQAASATATEAPAASSTPANGCSKANKSKNKKKKSKNNEKDKKKKDKKKHGKDKNKSGNGNGGMISNSTTTASGNNVQSFTGTLGGAPPPVISTAGAARPFSVNGDTFLNAGAALGRSCDVQHNACANAANSGKLAGGVAPCDAQDQACKAAAQGSNAQGGGDTNAGKQKGNGQDNNITGDKTNGAGQGQDNANANDSFGSCSDPTVKFANGLDGRNEPAFAPNNAADFQHGSALNIKVIADFICGQLKDKCKAGDAAVAKCDAASAVAEKETGQASADAFNSAIGM